MLQMYIGIPNYIVILSHYLILKMKKILILALYLCFCHLSRAQGEGSAMRVLTLPTSAHVVALGGESITATDAMPGIGLHNPALLASVNDRSVELQFMSYADGAKWMGAHYAMAFGERHTGAAYLQYMGYGEMEERDAAGNLMGNFSPKDMIFGVGYSYLLSDRWSGGANFKIDYSRIAEYSSAAIAVDLGLNYLDEEKDLSLSIAMRNIGAQVKTYDGVVERVPYNLQMGLTQGLAHLPVAFTVTLTDLTRWKKSDYIASGEDEKVGTGNLLLNHLVLGVEVRPRDNLWLALGYNFRRGYELKAADKAHMAGLSAGAGLNLRRFCIGLSWARYHKTTNSLMGSLAVNF